MALEINLSQERAITVKQAQQINKSTLVVIRIVDAYSEQKVIAMLEGFYEPVVLWEGAAYVAIGQWTDTDVQNRLLELFDI